jgi:hypothetical protein
VSISNPSSKPSSEQPIRSDDLLRKAAEVLELPPVASLWDDLVSHLGRALGVDWVFVAKLLPGTETNLRTFSAWHRGRPVEDLDYQLTVPFHDPLVPDGFVHVCDAREHLDNAWLKRVKAESFGQIKLIGSIGQAQGVLAIAHGQPLEGPDQIESMLRIYAFKASVELEREASDERFYCQLLETLQRPAVQQR